MHRFRIAILDTETTGLSPKFGDRIVEIGISKIHYGEIDTEDTFGTLLNPERPISLQASRVNKITDEMVASAPCFCDVHERFCAYLSNVDLILMHNAPFDLGFLQAEHDRMGKPFQLPPVLCTLALSRELYPEFQTHNLDALGKRFGVTIPEKERHRAVGDTLLTAQVFQKIFEENPLEMMSRLGSLVKL